jgi:hypothetical protein
LNSPALHAELDRGGFAIRPSGVAEADLSALISELEAITAEPPSRRAAELPRGGLRDVFRLVPSARRVATSGPLWQLSTSVLGSGCAPVRAILFDKTPGANWKVSWHQDLTIAVRRRVDVPGYGPWSVKAGVVHVQPPVAVLERMLTLRLHLDDCGADNGPVRVLPGSHRAGRLSGEAIDRCRAEHAAIECLASRGDVLAMRPLLLHASSPARSPAHRRVLHIEYAAVELAGGLEWDESADYAD